MLNTLFARSFDSRLQAIEEITKATWTAQTETQSYLSQFKASPPAPDPRFTWAQAPLRFEDAFGRVLPIPSEYNWSVFRLSQYHHKNLLTCYRQSGLSWRINWSTPQPATA